MDFTISVTIRHLFLERGIKCRKMHNDTGGHLLKGSFSLPKKAFGVKCDLLDSIWLQCTSLFGRLLKFAAMKITPQTGWFFGKSKLVKRKLSKALSIFFANIALSKKFFINSSFWSTPIGTHFYWYRQETAFVF